MKDIAALHYSDGLNELAKEYADNASPYCDAELEPIFSDLDLYEAFKAGYLEAMKKFSNLMSRRISSKYGDSCDVTLRQ